MSFVSFIEVEKIIDIEAWAGFSSPMPFHCTTPLLKKRRFKCILLLLVHKSLDPIDLAYRVSDKLNE